MDTTWQNISEHHIVCSSPLMIRSAGLWHGDNPFAFAVPLFIMQLTLIVVTSRVLFLFLRPFRQPRVISEILAGVVLGPSLMGRSKRFGSLFFPLKSIMVIESLGNLGLLYFIFLVGLEMDINLIRKTGRKAVGIAVSSMLVPLVTGTITLLALKGSSTSSIHQISFFLFLSVAFLVTAFPVLARILAELKLLNTDLGRIAMSSAIINEMCALILLALAVTLSKGELSPLPAIWVVLSGVAFVCFCLYIIQPTIKWIIKRIPEGDSIKDIHMCIILSGVMLSSVVTDAIGMHAIFGSFMFGLVIPTGPVAASLIEKLEDFMSGLLLPIFFSINGLRTNVQLIESFWGAVLLMLIILVTWVGKMIGILGITWIYGMPFREGLSLGMLMNTKGLVEMIILNIGRHQKVIDEQTFAIMVISALIMTAMITPVVTAIYRPARQLAPYKRRMIQQVKLDLELRVLVCIHNPRNVPTMIKLLEASCATTKSPVLIYALHLIELSERDSAMVIVHNSLKSGQLPVNQANTDPIANAFNTYNLNTNGTSTHCLTAVSPYSIMHEDVCDIAEEKRVAMIIIPFHKQQTVDGNMEVANPALQTINRNILANAPCSVGILVDRGLGGSNCASVSHHVGLLFFGGADDREALAYASQMAEHQGVRLAVVRFVAGETMMNPVLPTKKMLSVTTQNKWEQQLDDEYINLFRVKHAGVESVTFMERVITKVEETVAVIKEMGSIHDLCIVGCGDKIISPLKAGLEWSECPELGAIGDFLASSDFEAKASVLVVQQYLGSVSISTDWIGTPKSPYLNEDQYSNIDQKRPRASQVVPHSGMPSATSP